MPTEREPRFAGPRRGQLVFALAFLLLSVLLLGLIGQQTRWIDGAALFAQPRFWPAVGLGGMVVMGGLHLWRLPWRGLTGNDAMELLGWASALEYAVWFMGYVALVPLAGYLPVTVLFVALLARRLGYRGLTWTWIGVGFAVTVVVLFKSLLSVKIPGAVAYEYLPGALRGFFIVNF